MSSIESSTKEQTSTNSNSNKPTGDKQPITSDYWLRNKAIIHKDSYNNRNRTGSPWRSGKSTSEQELAEADSDSTLTYHYLD
jgi:hypothetical protein